MIVELKHILAPTDFSAHSRSALYYAAALAEKFAARITLLHVYQDMTLFLPETIAAGAVVVPPVEQMISAVHESLSREVQECKLDHLKPALEVREGSAYYEIVRFAEEAGADLIVLGTHGRGALAHLLMGSVAEKVVRKSPCPVLTVRDPNHKFAHP
jgi:nucleotide-binding universal stress UspA family protein